ncbi:MAG: tol-pal system protein YbgF [Gammaproteobacteria bacterium]|nr:tol-pal system protein YbgF [Gammaproteobacteria bacterium]
MRRYALILACAFALAPPAWAVSNAELARQVQALQQLAGELDARLVRLETAMQQTPQLLGLLNEVETLKAEVAKLRGQAEVQVHQVDTLGKRQNDLYADLDQRISDLAKAGQPAPVVDPAPAVEGAQPAAPVAAGDSPQADPLVESRSYEAALKQFREANYAGAIAGFNGFLKAYPASALASNAQYWIGYSYYALKDYKTALAHQQKLVAAYPASAKVPDALLNVATNQLALDDLDGARKTLEDLVAKYPGTQAATLAARRLATLK